MNRLDELGEAWASDTAKSDEFLTELHREARKAFLDAKTSEQEEEILCDMLTVVLDTFEPETFCLSEYMQKIFDGMKPKDDNDQKPLSVLDILEINENMSQASATDLYGTKWFYEISYQMFEFAQGCEKNAVNDDSLFYTSGLVEYCQRLRSHPPKFQHETAVVACMKVPFAKYCMKIPVVECFSKKLSIETLCRAKLKKYGKVSETCREEEKNKAIPLPIPADVGVCYLERKEKRYDMTEQKYQEKQDAYQNEMRELFQTTR